MATDVQLPGEDGSWTRTPNDEMGQVLDYLALVSHDKSREARVRGHARRLWLRLYIRRHIGRSSKQGFKRGVIVLDPKVVSEALGVGRDHVGRDIRVAAESMGLVPTGSRSEWALKGANVVVVRSGETSGEEEVNGGAGSRAIFGSSGETSGDLIPLDPLFSGPFPTPQDVQEAGDAPGLRPDEYVPGASLKKAEEQEHRVDTSDVPGTSFPARPCSPLDKAEEQEHGLTDSQPGISAARISPVANPTAKKAGEARRAAPQPPPPAAAPLTPAPTQDGSSELPGAMASLPAYLQQHIADYRAGRVTPPPPAKLPPPPPDLTPL